MFLCHVELVELFTVMDKFIFRNITPTNPSPPSHIPIELIFLAMLYDETLISVLRGYFA